MLLEDAFLTFRREKLAVSPCFQSLCLAKETALWLQLQNICRDKTVKFSYLTMSSKANKKCFLNCQTIPFNFTWTTPMHALSSLSCLKLVHFLGV